ncbi:hypothetical protein D3C80_2009020 [compost metagenome]
MRGIEADNPAQTLVMKDRDAEDALIALTNELDLYRPRCAREIMNIVDRNSTARCKITMQPRYQCCGCFLKLF